MKKKLLLFDGLSIANRAFYGIPLLTTKEGVYTNAVYGFLNIMLSLIEKEKPDLVGVAFDVNKPTFRHVQVATYKGTRKGMPEELRPQIPLLKEVLTALGIFTIEKEGYEADDILGTLAKMAEKDGYEVVVVSGDRDLLQITSTSIELKIPKTKQGGTEIESYRAQDVFEKYEVTPQAFIDVKGLMGDTSDNIKGVPGVGEKTAIKLIKTYGSMEKLYAEIASVTQKKLYENLMTYKEQAFESKMLATIVCDVPLTYTWQDFSYNLQLNEKSLALFKRLEFKKLIDKLPKNEGAAKDKEKVEVDGLTLEMFQKFLMQEELTLTYFYEIDRLYLAMRTTIGTGYYELHETDDQAIKSLKIFCEKPVGQLNMHGSKKFRHVLSLYGIELNKPVFDTELAAYLLAPTTATYEVATIEELLLGDTILITQEMWLGKGKSAKKLKDIEFAERKNVLGEQVYHLANLVPLLEAELEKLQMKKLFDEIEMPLVEVLFAMEKEGIYVDQEELKVLGEKLDMLIKETEEKIYETVGERDVIRKIGYSAN
jgi:DNA polymerase-1